MLPTAPTPTRNWMNNKNVSVTKLNCHRHKMIVYLDTPNVQEDFYIHLLNSTCNYYVSILNIVQGVIKLPIDYNSCGTILTNDVDHVSSYMNQLHFTSVDGVDFQDCFDSKYTVSMKCKQTENTVNEEPSSITTKTGSKFSIRAFKFVILKKTGKKPWDRGWND